MTIVDPPSGWCYGFPRVFDIDREKETIEEWFLSKGYPQSLIDQGMLKYCRYWETDAED
jgi:protein-disulfide isomerase-like protein with CxxC motif